MLAFSNKIGAQMKKNIGNIITLFISQKEYKKRLEKRNLRLDKKGIISDKYYNKDIQRSILITSTQSYALAEANNVIMPYGSLGENILIDYNPYHLIPGTKLQIGNVLLEISQRCTMCDHLSNINNQLPTLLKDDRGIFAKVLIGGTISKDDTILLMKT